ncbi:MAG: radical SAM protein [Thermodesulfobacteriota bacterium]|nr:radical SAM protein [Thermodesulfobacteriota bacterium]
MQTPFRILFIKPHLSTYGIEYLEIPTAFLYLSAYLKAYITEPVEIKLVDLRLEKNPSRALQKILYQYQPNLIGITLLTHDQVFITRWMGFLRTLAPEAFFVAGGPGATYGCGALLQNSDLDCVVLGEGERVFLNLVTCLAGGQSFKRIRGVAYLEDGRVIKNSREPYIEDMDTIPMPDYGLIDPKLYQGFLKPLMNVVSVHKKRILVVSSRACPYQCVYCHSIFGKKVRYRSPEHFVREIAYLYHEHGIREFHIVDDIFNLHRDRMRQILNMIIDSGMKIKLAFPNGLRGDLLEPADILLMKKAGAYQLTFAIETASPRIQRFIKKNLDLEKVIQNIAFARKHGVLTRGFFMLGFPGETVQEIQKTISFALQSKLHLANFFIVVPYRGTELARMAETISPAFFSSSIAAEAQFYTKKSFYHMTTGYDLSKIQLQAFLRFYLRWPFLTTIIRFPIRRSLLRWPKSFIEAFVPLPFRKKKQTPKGPKGSGYTMIDGLFVDEDSSVDMRDMGRLEKDPVAVDADDQIVA